VLFPASEQFGLINQLRRASVSVARNIAEGYGRSTSEEYRKWMGNDVTVFLPDQ
jgi:four helix bundle protein